ncbi:MAG: AzlC family ABC transporter permease [Acidimicrobiia bacterium]|nr:AzlC family ABC transporter permease [Acidimicrobiia bacterium]
MTALTRPRSVVEAGARTPFVEGARDIGPMALSVAPFGLAIGAAVGASSVPDLAGWAGGPLILAGSAQLTAVEMIDAGAAPAVTVLSALVLNVRILMYGAAMAPWFRHQRLSRRLLLAMPLIDQLFLVAAPRFERGDLDERGRQAYYVGAAALLVGTWVLAQTVGVVAGVGLPATWGLHLAAPLALAGLLAKSITGRPAAVAAAVAGLLAVVGAGLPHQSAVLVAALVGVAAGGVCARHAPERARS